MSINSVSISGNVGASPRVNETLNGGCVLEFTVAVNDRVKVNDKWEDVASWVNCVMFGNRARSLAQHVHKGTKVAIQGKLKQDKWQDKKTGENRSALKVIVNEIELMNRRERPAEETRTETVIDDSDIPF